MARITTTELSSSTSVVITVTETKDDVNTIVHNDLANVFIELHLTVDTTIIINKFQIIKIET